MSLLFPSLSWSYLPFPEADAAADTLADTPFQAALLASLLDHPIDLANDPLDPLLAIPGISRTEVDALEQARIEGVPIRTMEDLEELLGPAAALRLEPFVSLSREHRSRGHLHASLSGSPVRNRLAGGSIAFADRADSVYDVGFRLQPGDSLALASKHLRLFVSGGSLQLGDLDASPTFSSAWSRSSFQTAPQPGLSLPGFRLQGASVRLGTTHRLDIGGHLRGSRGGLGFQGDSLRERALFLALGSGPLDVMIARSIHQVGTQVARSDLAGASFTHTDSLATHTVRILVSHGRASEAGTATSSGYGYAIQAGSSSRSDRVEWRTSASYRSAEFQAHLGNGSLGRSSSPTASPPGEGWQFATSLGTRLVSIRPEIGVRIARPRPKSLERSISGGASASYGVWSTSGRLAWEERQDSVHTHERATLVLAPEYRPSSPVRLGLRWTRHQPSSGPGRDLLVPWAAYRESGFTLSGSLMHSSPSQALGWELSQSLSIGGGPKSRAPLELDVRLSGQSRASGAPLRIASFASFRW